MSAVSVWLLFIALAVGTYTLRLSFIYLFGKIEMPDWLRRALRSVPASVLAALVFPALTYPNGALDLSLGNVRLLAGVRRMYCGRLWWGWCCFGFCRRCNITNNSIQVFQT